MEINKYNKYFDKYFNEVKNKNPNYELIDYIKADYKDGKILKKSKLNIKCGNCGNNFVVRPDDFIKRNHGCTNCCGSYEKSFAYHIEQELGLDINVVWDFEKNTLNPYNISRCTKNKVWIKCLEKDYHESYEISCSEFVIGQRCPYCVSKKIHVYDSFAQYHIDNTDKDFLEKYWDWDKNNELGINPWEIAPNSNKIKVWTKCQNEELNALNNMKKREYHNSYFITCNSFTSGKRCPSCTNRPNKVKMYDSFGYAHPNLAQMWSIKNDISPYQVAKSSNKKYLFVCDECGCELEKSISLIDSKGFSCPNCNQSEGEKRVRNWLISNNINYIFDQAYFKDLIGLGGGLLRPDFILPDHKIWIEYDGEFHFGKGISKQYQNSDELEIQKQHDKLKDDYAKKHNWKLIRIPYWNKDIIENILETKVS